jgi:hypothetical protein
MTLPHSAFCACCSSPAPPVPFDISNRPGLSAIAYRIGTFASFRETMLEAIAGEPALASLTTRQADDYAVTIIDLFAAVGDVLTFYNERIANELYLRTARERDSLLRLTRLIGYRMRPGLAAQTMLAFTLDAGAETRIRKGLKVMSVPGQDELAQTFETTEQIIAHADINDLPAFGKPALINVFRLGSTGGPIISRPEKLAVDDRLVFFGLGIIEEKKVTAIQAQPGGEAIAFNPSVQANIWWPEVARAARLEGRLRFFGHNAPSAVNVYVPANPPSVLWPKWISKPVVANFGVAETTYPLDGRHTDIASGTQLLIDAGPAAVPRLRTAAVVKTEDLPTNLETLEDTVTHLHLRQTIRGRPAVVAGLGGGHAVFARSGTSAALALGATGLRQWAYQNLDNASSDITGVGPGVGRTDIFARDRLGRLRQRILTGIASLAWVNHGGILTSEPRPVARPGGTVNVFVRGLDLGLWSLDATSGSPGLWTSLGGVLTSPPAPVATGGATLAVFARGLDRALWYRSWNGAAWSGWTSLKGVLATTPAAASGAGRIDVVALDDSGSLIHRLNDGSNWSDWRNLGGKLEGDVAIVAGPSNRIDVLAKGVDGGGWHIARIGSAWTNWTELGGALTSAPSAARDSAGIHVYARFDDATIAYRALLGSGWTEWASLGEGIGSVPDRRKTAIYRISAEDIVWRDYDYPAAASAAQVVVRLSPQQTTGLGGLKHLEKGRRFMLHSGGRSHLATVTATTLLPVVPGDLPDHLFVDFTPALPEPFEAARLVGNVAAASHGAMQPDEPLGHGEAAKAFQKFRLSRQNLTYLQSGAKLEGEAALEIRVNGELWNEVPSLYGRKPGERVYTARQTDTAETIVAFGDGKTGARVPSGALNVVARYRTGLGLEGLMKPEQLSIPLERPVGLRAVANPLPADGAADPERRDNARTSAPNTVRTFGRAVSLADFEQIATSTGLAQRASVTWVWRDLGRSVHVTVAGPGGAKLSSLSLGALHAAMDSARDINRPLSLGNLVRVPVVVSARILRDPAFEADSVLEAAKAELLSLFAFETMQLGEAVFLSGVYAALQGGRGVAAVDVDVFQLKGYASLTPAERAIRAVTAGAVQPHIRIFPARPTPPAAMIDRFAKAGFDGPVPPPVLAAEQAFIEAPAADIKLTVVEAL